MIMLSKGLLAQSIKDPSFHRRGIEREREDVNYPKDFDLAVYRILRVEWQLVGTSTSSSISLARRLFHWMIEHCIPFAKMENLSFHLLFLLIWAWTGAGMPTPRIGYAAARPLHDDFRVTGQNKTPPLSLDRAGLLASPFFSTTLRAQAYTHRVYTCRAHGRHTQTDRPS
jgi:hypothetical protein